MVVATVLFSLRVEATQCRAIGGGSPALEAIDAETRLEWLTERFSVDARRAKIWSGLWTSAYGALTVAQLALLPTANSTGERAEKVVGAASSFIGFLAGLALPLKIMYDDGRWRRHLQRHAGDDPCALLNTAELLLLRDAESEAFGVGPLVHVGNFAINIAGGLVLGLGYGRWSAFAYQTLVGIAVGEAQVITQPTDVIEDLRLYRAGQLDFHPRPPRLGVAMAPIIGRDAFGGTLTLRW
jgi:hypothetical protein